MAGATPDIRLDKACDELSAIADGLRSGKLTNAKALNLLERPKRRIAAVEALLSPEEDEEE